MKYPARLLEIVTHDQPQLSDNNHDEHNRRSDLHGEDLDVQLYQPDPCGPIECLPCIKHRYRTAAAQDLRLDFAGEGTVEGDDGLVFLGKHGSLDTLEGDVRGDGDEDDRPKGDEANQEHLHQRDFLYGGSVLAIVAWVLESITHSDEKSTGHVDGSLLGHGENSRGDDDVLASLDGGKAAEPALGAWLGDDNMGPSHLKPAKSDRCDDGNNWLPDGMGHVGSEKVNDQAVREVIDD